MHADSHPDVDGLVDEKAVPRAPVRTRLLGVEAMRGIAALVVCLCHATNILALPKDYGQQFLDGFLEQGRAGVDFFFVLSGFIMMYLHLRAGGARQGASRFMLGRIARIYPPYIVASLGFLLLLVVSPTPAAIDPWFLIESLLLLPADHSPLLGIGWSLQHEMIFYVIFALFLLDRRLGALVFFAWMGGTVLNMATGGEVFVGVWATLIFRVFNIQFLFGITCAWLVLHRPIRAPLTVAMAGAVMFMGLWTLLHFVPVEVPDWPPVHLGYALASAMILYGLAVAEAQTPLRVPSFFVMLGATSYSLYLVHVPVLLVLSFALRFVNPVLGLPLWLAFALIVAGSIAAGAIFHHLVEVPFTSWAAARLTGRRRVAPACAV